MRALLFDIDGTLTKSHGAGTRALSQTLLARPRAAEELRRMRLDGMTDRAIVRLLLAAEAGHAAGEPGAPGNPHDHPGPPPITERALAVEDAAIDAVLAGYLEVLERECARQAYQPLPGVAALVAALAKRPDVLLGLCTGNVARGAELKLGAAGLWGPFAFGGFGSDAEARPDVVRAAVRRARERGAGEVLVIDDTPRGVLAAHEAGVACCGVATGRWSVHDLAVHGADLVVESFADLERSLALLTGPLPARPAA